MSHCPCCSYSLLRQIKLGKVYWFCPHCWQAMPNFEEREKVVSYLKRSSLEQKQILEQKLSSAVTV